MQLPYDHILCGIIGGLKVNDVPEWVKFRPPFQRKGLWTPSSSFTILILIPTQAYVTEVATVKCGVVFVVESPCTDDLSLDVLYVTSLDSTSVERELKVNLIHE